MAQSRSPVAFGQYIITRRIARGGMAEIYRARTRTQADQGSRWAAIKMMRPSIGHEQLREQLFKREARIASAIAHPNVIPLYQFGLEMERHYLAMEYVRGRDLSHLLKNEKKGRELLPHELGLYIGYQAAAGLGYAHRLTDERGERMDIVHRDISPGNVMVGYDGQVKVLDFGVARMNETEGMRTQTGTLRGKFAYMSPEQTLGEPLDARSDVFSLGTVLYELLTGSNCFRADNPIATLDRVQRVRPVPPSRANRTIPQALDRILARCLAKDRRRRFPDCTTLEEALGEYLDKVGFAGRELLARHMRERFAWEKAEEEKELLREEEEVALLEVVDFALVGEDVGLDAKEVAVSQEEEASESEVKSARLRGTEDEGEVFDSGGKEEGNEWDPSEPGAMTVAIPGKAIQSLAFGPGLPNVPPVSPAFDADPSEFEKTVAQPRLQRFRDDEEIEGREVELASILAGPGAKDEAESQSIEDAASGPAEILVGRRAPEFATLEEARSEDLPVVIQRETPAKGRLARPAVIVAALGAVVLVVATLVTTGIESQSKGESKPVALQPVKRTKIAPVTIMVEEHARRASKRAAEAPAPVPAPEPAADPETPHTPAAETPMATGNAAASEGAASSMDLSAEEEPAGDADDEPASEATEQHHGTLRHRRSSRARGHLTKSTGSASNKAAPASKRPAAVTVKAAPPQPKGQASSGKATGFLNVGAKPWAEISIDGRPWPYQTPQAGIELSTGKHTITLFNRETGVTRSQAVLITQGAYKTISVDMTKR